MVTGANAMRVLVVEDEPKTGAYLKKGLEESGCQVDVATDGSDGLFLAQEYPYDVIVLDVMLPGHGRLDRSSGRCGRPAPRRSCS
jgi:DNA-binding response OmpR family regulator